MLGQSKNYLKSINKSALYVVLFISGCSYCSATSIFVILTPKGIVVAADSEAVTRHVGPDVSPPVSTVNKLFLIRQRVVVGTVGLGDSYLTTLDDKPLFHYYPDSFIREVRKRTPENASVRQIVDAIQSQSSLAFAPLRNLIEHRVIERNDCARMQYVVAGYESGVPTVKEINFEIDWENLQLRGPLLEPVFPAPHARRNYFGYHAASYGYMFAASKALFEDVGTEAYKSVTAEAGRELQMLLSGQDLSLKDATALLHAFLRAEHNEAPAAVGPPYKIAWILKAGGIKRINYRD